MRLWPQLLQAPALTGAVAPSSAYLARAMADAARGAGALVELGAGTGPVTRALARQYPATPLVAVELQPRMARQLARALPQVHVQAGAADAVLHRLHDTAPAPLVLVSSLPFRSLPPAVHARTRDSILACLARHPGSWLVQFTYHLRAPFGAPPGWRWRRGRTVVANLPPATVWTLWPPGAGPDGPDSPDDTR